MYLLKRSWIDELTTLSYNVLFKMLQLIEYHKNRLNNG